MDIYGRPGFATRELITPIRDKRTHIDQRLIDPSYSDHRFIGPNSAAKTIFLARGLEITNSDFGTESVSGLFYNYSDRLEQQHGYEKMRSAREEAKEKIGNIHSAGYFEQILKNLEGNESIKLGHILSGVNVATLYSYRVFGYSTE